MHVCALTQFTSKERDAETGLDYFEARYMSSAQGRFTSPDDAYYVMGRIRETTNGVTNLAQDNDGQPIESRTQGYSNRFLSNPQSWNLYSYVWNNPISLIDPTGHEPACLTGDVWGPGNAADCVKNGGKWEELPGVATTTTVNGNTDEVKTSSSTIDWHDYLRSRFANRFNLSDRPLNKGPVFDKPAPPKNRPKPSLATCLIAPHDFMQNFYGGPQSPSDPLLGNSSELPWQPTSFGWKQVGSTGGQTRASARALITNTIANSISDCANYQR